MAIITLKPPQYVGGFAVKAEFAYNVDGQAVFWVDAKQAALASKSGAVSLFDEASLILFADEVEVIHP